VALCFAIRGMAPAIARPRSSRKCLASTEHPGEEVHSASHPFEFGNEAPRALDLRSRDAKKILFSFVDDHPLIYAALKTNDQCAAGLSVVAEATSGKQALEHGGEGIAPLHGSLSAREFQVSCKIATGESVSQIAGQLCLSVKTVSTYRRRIL
jgi:hypothetical protein